MSKLGSRPLLSFLMIAAAACAGPRIATHSTHAADVDFGALRTFAWLGVTPMAYTAVSEQGVLDLVGAELAAKGLQRDDAAPDLLVAVHRTVEGTLNTKGSGYEFRDGRLRRYELQEGSMVVDLITATDRQVAWRGTAEGAFRFDMTPAERQERLAEVLHDMFADFPPRR